MKDKRIVVLVKFFKGELNPFDGAALECALKSNAKEIIVLSMAPLSVLDGLKSLTRLGVKAVLISDKLYAGSDTIATSYVLSKAISRLSPDYVFCGRQSIDGDTSQVPPMIAQRLGYDIKVRVMALSGETVSLRNGTSEVLKDNTVLTFEKIDTLRFPSIFSSVGKVTVWDNEILQLPIEKCGLIGSPTRVLKTYESAEGIRTCNYVKAENFSDSIFRGLNSGAVDRSETQLIKLDACYFVGNIIKIANRIADKAVEIDVCGKSAEETAKYIIENNIGTVLWEDRDDLKILASKVAVLTGAGICADCISFKTDNGKLVMVRPALGGNITAEISCASDKTFATVRTAKKGVSDLIFSVGKGAAAYIEDIKKLAEEYGAEICCSRSVADSGILPYEKQVGLTGKTASPKVYVAFGISGAVQHTCAISSAGTIIAVNSDKNAKIFNYADYGIVSDIGQFLTAISKDNSELLGKTEERNKAV